ncbi:MAG: hypothetical protein JRF40_00810 [Deltaproteobacteria bacterium]|nr:hypothetical protein [Deltaproteobacteria bacterium]MBW2218022.1 hypothetical protein [Deltaproteobacteria bacterium]
MYFKISDFLIPTLIGGLAGLFTFWIVNPEWNMFFGMGMGMVWGMVLQVPVILFLMPLFGAFEVMVPAMISGMASGMFCGMLAVMYSFTLSTAFIIGCGMGVLVWLWIGVKNRQLKGVVQ